MKSPRDWFETKCHKVCLDQSHLLLHKQTNSMFLFLAHTLKVITLYFLLQLGFDYMILGSFYSMLSHLTEEAFTSFGVQSKQLIL